MDKLKVAVFASGRGSNLEAILGSTKRGEINAEVVAVVVNNPNANAIMIGEEYGVPVIVSDHRDFTKEFSRKGGCNQYFQMRKHEDDIEKELEKYSPELIALAGYMRILTDDFIAKRYNSRKNLPGIINIHPSLLPAFPGRRGYKDALSYGAKWTGVTVHFVDQGTDTGPIIAQEIVPILPDDSVESLERRGLAVEHRIYPEVIGWYADGRLRIDGRKVSAR
jgi:phosphoribosylglycinamide formyltransferase 1